METVTGFLRRADSKSLSRTLPIGILPIGVNNMMAKHLYPDVQGEFLAGISITHLSISINRPYFKF